MSPMEPHKSDSIAPLDESLQFMPSDDEEQLYWKMRSIYRVPARITALNREAYQPQVVSFGPYHHGEAHLLPMEERKHRVVRHFLKRSKKPRERFFESLREVAWDLEESYDALDPKWKASSGKGAARQFLELLINDGCFMLEILRFAADEVGDYAPNDPIFSKHGDLFVMPDIMQDMLMLENQLPMLVLGRLVAVASDGEKDDEFVNSLIIKSFILIRSKDITGMGKCLHVLDVFRKHKLKEPKKKDNVERKYSVEIIHSCLHVLDVFRKHMPDVFRKHMLKKPKDNVEMKNGVKLLRSASVTELSEHGIQFKNSETQSLRDISFVGGVLRLPRIIVGDRIKSVFLNLMAFERFHVGAGNEVTYYICFMDHIIDKEQDVALLRAQGILQNDLESDEAVAKLFNLLAKGATVAIDSSINDVFNEIEEYCSKRWNMWRANFIHTYFRNPWVTLSLIAATFLFALTIIQTVYSVLGFASQ